jgi:hypothetical protein
MATNLDRRVNSTDVDFFRGRSHGALSPPHVWPHNINRTRRIARLCGTNLLGEQRLPDQRYRLSRKVHTKAYEASIAGVRGCGQMK